MKIKRDWTSRTWSHGKKADPKTWPCWKLFHLSWLDIKEANKWQKQESRFVWYYRLIIYTKRVARSWDFTKEKNFPAV